MQAIPWRLEGFIPLQQDLSHFMTNNQVARNEMNPSGISPIQHKIDVRKVMGYALIT